MNPSDLSTGIEAATGEELLDALVSDLSEAGERVALDLTDDPPVVVARTSGRIFAAAWPGESGLVVRIRLDAPPLDDRFRPTGGSLSYESVVTTRAQVAELVDMLRDALGVEESPRGRPLGP